MIALTALGNRAWGSGAMLPVFNTACPHWLGAILMATGLWLGKPYPLIALPLLFISVYVWRMFSSAPWLNLEVGDDWSVAIGRNLPLMGIMALRMLFLPSMLSLGSGVFAMVIGIPAAYYLAGKQNKVDPTALAEFISGAFVGMI